MMRKYETMFILKPTLNEEEVKAKVELIKKTLEGQGATIVAEDLVGSRPLAYRIDKFERGFYVVIYFTSDGKSNLELERVYRINEDFIRTVVIKYEKKVEVAAWENMVKKANGEPHKDVGFVERKPRRDFNKDDRYNKDNRTPREYPKKEAVKTEEVRDAK